MSYKVWIDPIVIVEAQATPGNIRQRIKQAMKALANDPRPPDSEELYWPPRHFEPRRIQIHRWRIIYAVDDDACWVWILAVRKRPPYDYGDLNALLDRIR
jgi:mRNA interferase RelE/StbE